MNTWQPVSKDEIKKLQHQCNRIAFRMGYPDLADDLYQEALIQLWQKGKVRTIKYILIDIVRREQGRPGSIKNAAIGGSGALELKEEIFEYEMGDKHMLDLSKIVDSNFGKENLTKRISFYLRYKYGFSNAEIGELLMVCESRAAQFALSVEQVVKRTLNKEKRFIEGKKKKKGPEKKPLA